ncbi:MAG: ABC transporter permease subunit [Phycisphaerales bacterium]
MSFRLRAVAPWCATLAIGALAPLAVIVLLAYCARSAWPAIVNVNVAFATDRAWLPTDGRFGGAALVLGTLATTARAVVVAVPIGLGAALSLAFFAGPRLRRAGELAIGALAGLPTVVVGLVGIAWIVPLAGYSLLSAGLVLALMIVPTFAWLAVAALRDLPPALFDNGRVLGLTDEALVFRLALRAVRPWLVGAATLAACRALGEAVAVSMVAGNIANFPFDPTTPIRTLASTLVLEVDPAVGVHRSALFVVALLMSLAIGVAGAVGGRLAERS